MKKRRIPLRMCLGCQEMKPKRELLRIVKSKEGNISFDPIGKESGRGAYLCKDTECFNIVLNGRKLEKTFSCKIDDTVYEMLKKQLEEAE